MKVIEAISKGISYLSDEQAGQLIKAVCAYAEGETTDITDRVVAMAFLYAKSEMDRQANLNKGGAPRGNRNARKQQVESETTGCSKNNRLISKQPVDLKTTGCLGCFEGVENPLSEGVESAEIQSVMEVTENETTGCLVVFESDELFKEELPLDSPTPSSVPLPPTTPITSLSSTPPIIPQEETLLGPKNLENSEKPKKTKVELPPLDDFVDLPELRPIFETWLQYKKERNENYKPTGLVTAYKKLKRFSGGDPAKAEEIIENAMGNNSQGFFPLKNGYSQTPNQGTIARENAMNPNERYQQNQDYDF